MKRLFCTLQTVAVVTVFASVISTNFAATIYDNTSVDTGTRFYLPGGTELGNQIILDQTDLTDRTLSLFSFQYYATNFSGNSLAGSVGVTLTLYRADGPLFNARWATPGTVIWTGPEFTLPGATPGATLNYNLSDFGPSVTLPANELVWAVKFSYTDPNDQAGLCVFAPTAIGSSYNDYWQSNSVFGMWELLQLGGGLSNTFAAHLEATPEPATLWLVGAGGLLGFLVVRRRLRGQ
jgi:hypothetical protein